MPEENDYTRSMASRYTGQARRAQRPPRRPAPPSARVLPQVSSEAAEVIEGSGGIFQGAWQRYLVGMGLRSNVDPRDMLRGGMGGVFEAGREIGEAYEDSRQYYGMKPPTRLPRVTGGWRGVDVESVEQAPGYRDAGADWGRVGDAESILRGMDPGLVARLQDRLIGAGFMSGGAFGVGSPVDEKTVDAFKGLLGYANSQGSSWEAALANAEQMAEELGLDGNGDDRAPFVAPTYVAPDYATLAQRTKSMLREELGRDPDESELALFTAEMSGWDREAFDVEAAAARAEWEAAEDGRDASPTAQAVDPVARFKESFEKRFAGELRGIQRTAEATETNETVRGAVSTLSQMSGGMG